MCSLDCISQFSQRETLPLDVAFKNGGGSVQRTWQWSVSDWNVFSKLWNVSFLFSLIFFFLFFFGSASALNVWAYNWGKANTVLKQTYISPCLSKCSVSHTGICFLSLNWTLIVFWSCVASIMICMKNAFCSGNDDQDPGGDDRGDRIMTLWGANVL